MNTFKRFTFGALLGAALLPSAALAEEAATGDAIAQAQAVIKAHEASGKIDKSNPAWRVALPKYPLLTFDKSKTYVWTLNTNKGKMTYKFLPEHAPNHVSSFIYLSELGYYDGLSFHRVIKGFMAQAGCPYGRGNGGPGYKLPHEAKVDVKHDSRGTLSMARTSDPNSGGSQFFITFGKTASLDVSRRSPGYTVFGRMTGGEEALAAIEAAGRQRDPAPPTEPLTILSAKVSIE